MTAPFRGSASGLTKQQLRNPRYSRVTHDVYVLAEPGLDLLTRVDAAKVALPDGVPCTITSGLLQKLPVDDDGVVHLGRAPGAARSRREEIAVHRLLFQPDELMVVKGRTISSGPRTFTDLAVDLDLEDLAAVGDVVLRRWGDAALDEAVRRAAGRPGVSLLRAVRPLLDPGSDSPAETRARLRLHAAGFTALRHKVTVTDRGGGWLGVPDLADPVAKVGLQHEGAVHFLLGEAQRRKDLDRDEVVRQEDWQVVSSTALDLATPDRLVRKMTAAYLRSAALWGPHVLPEHLRVLAAAQRGSR
jgi:hypothetical protein